MSKHVLIYHLYINIFAFREEENEILLTGEREREGGKRLGKQKAKMPFVRVKRSRFISVNAEKSFSFFKVYVNALGAGGGMKGNINGS